MKWSWEVAAGIAGTVTVVLGWIKWAIGRTAQVEANTKSIDELKGKLDTILEELQKINLQQQALSVALFGYDGTNGLRSEIRAVKADVASLREDLIEHLSQTGH